MFAALSHAGQRMVALVPMLPSLENGPDGDPDWGQPMCLFKDKATSAITQPSNRVDRSVWGPYSFALVWEFSGRSNYSMPSSVHILYRSSTTVGIRHGVYSNSAMSRRTVSSFATGNCPPTSSASNDRNLTARSCNS